MAYVNQEKKAKIAEALKLVMPKGWKYTLAVRHHSTIVLTIASAPIDILAERARVCASRKGMKLEHEREHVNLNVYHLDAAFDGELLTTFKAIKAALDTGNHDRSDLMSDLFDVGHYVEINVGRWNKSFEVRA